MPVDGGGGAAKNAGQAGLEAPPLGPREFGRVEFLQRKRSVFRAAPWREPAGHGGCGVLGEFAFEYEGFHRCTRSRIGAMGNNLRGAPPDLRKSSISHPRLRAIVANLVSGFTATGKPTASSIGR